VAARDEVGDFEDAPPTASLPRVAPDDPGVVVDALTTATRQVRQFRDGTRRAVVSAEPVRFRGGDGQWRDIVLDVAAQPSGRLGPAASPTGVSVAASTSDSALVEVATPAGPMSMAVVDVRPSSGAVQDRTAVVFPTALSGNRSATIRPLTTGFELDMSVPDAAAWRV
jgi:hypothetical protein